MNDFIYQEALKFAKMIHASTRDYEKLVPLQTRLEKELTPYSSLENRLAFLNHLEDEVKTLFRKHLAECTKIDSCPQHKTHNNVLFLVAQEKERIINRSHAVAKTNTEMNHLLDIFISHSSQDAEFAKLLIELIRSALNIPADRIRCTSVSGYKLPIGASTDEQLKTEIFDARVFIGIISPNSNNSAYVAFELGARWGNKLPLYPLITSNMGAELLKGPLKSINALNSSKRADLFQLITNLAKELGKVPESPSVYEDKLAELVAHSLRETIPHSDLLDNLKSTLPATDNGFSDTEAVIKVHCQKDWPDDYTMQLHCMQQQRQAVTELEKPKPDDLSDTEFTQIRKKAMMEWPVDFVMQLHAQKTQIESLWQLKSL